MDHPVPPPSSLFFGRMESAGSATGPASSSAAMHQPSIRSHGPDCDDDDEHRAQLSRVQLVSSRRKPSEDMDELEIDAYRSSYTSNASSSHHMYQYGGGNLQQSHHHYHNPLTSMHSSLKKSMLTSSSSSSYIEASTPEWKKLPPSASKSKTESKAMASNDAQDERKSLPTLENPKKSKRKQQKSTKSLKSSSTHPNRESMDSHFSHGHGRYHPPGSPHMSSTHSTAKSRTKSGRSGISQNELKTTILTEVGADTSGYALPLFHSKDDKPCRKSQLDRVVDPTHVTIEETQKYTFAIVLKHTDQVYRLLRQRFPSKSAASIRRDLPYQVSQLQQKCVRRLIQAGLGVTILDNDVYDGNADDRDEEEAGKNICVMIDPKKDKDLLLHEFKREMDELAIREGKSIARLGEESLDSIKEMCFSPALELQLTHNIIQNALKDYDKEEWVIDVNKELTVNDVILDCFPLHDRTFNKKFFAEYRKRTLEMNPRKAASGNIDRWAVEELRLHFGERVAFLFAFMHIYTKHLMPIMIAGVTYYLAFRFASGQVWKQYLEGLTVLGFCVVCFWGPSFLVCWQRETSILVEKWNLEKYKNTVYERNDYNPSFQYLWVKNELTKEMEKVPKQRKNHWIQLTMLFYVLLSAVIQCLCLMPFIQWYVYAKNAPVCDTCHAESDGQSAYECLWYVTCFHSQDSSLGTDRWLYILVQGILLGLLIDIIFFEVFNWVSEKFVRWENYAKKSDYENRLIHRRFVFVWSNWFFWFLFLAFVYLPYGDVFLRQFKAGHLEWLAPYEWNPELLTLDTLFVTPLVVTQFLNMILETFVPYLLRKLRGRPVVCRKSSPFAWCGNRLGLLFRKQRNKFGEVDQDASKNLTAKRLASLVKQKTDFTVPVLLASDDCNQYSAYEIIAELKLPIFDPMLDYLDACIQFSYVIMFTVVWPLLPLPAFVNNLLEVRGDAFRLLFGNRRPMPRRDTSIGEWMTVLSYANIIGVTVVMGFIVAYHWGYFMTSGCNFKFGDGFMVPFATIDECKPEIESYGTARWKMLQIVVFVLLEHFGFCLRYLVLQIEKTPSAIRNSGYQRLKQIQQLTSSRTAHSSQFVYVQKLRELFDKYDVEGDGHLAENELIPFLAEWICKHPSELLPCSGIIFRYMDKNGLGKVPFATCCLMLQHVNHDRFFSCLLGVYDPMNGELNEEIWRTDDAIEFRRVMSVVSSVVSERRSSMASMASMSIAESFIRPRDSTFFYVEPQVTKEY
uniref:EF-hand domain-containing protein n=1 Tax=Globisporangium ultimum (strain ATCC 200006 / CBS 805.95 / DAOM BR144) TaxID=431595 RepID=K3W8K8_GLOUD